MNCNAFICLQAHLYYTKSGTCSAFIANTDEGQDLTAKFNGNTYSLPAWSKNLFLQSPSKSHV
jgi:hypothetical protein